MAHDMKAVRHEAFTCYGGRSEGPLEFSDGPSSFTKIRGATGEATETARRITKKAHTKDPDLELHACRRHRRPNDRRRNVN